MENKVIFKKTECYFCEEVKICNNSWTKDIFVCEQCYDEQDLKSSDKREWTWEDSVNLYK